MYDDVREWFHERPIFQRSLWVVLSVAVLTILVVLATGTVGTSPQHVSTGVEVTVTPIPLGQVTDDSQPSVDGPTSPDRPETTIVGANPATTIGTGTGGGSGTTATTVAGAGTGPVGPNIPTTLTPLPTVPLPTTTTTTPPPPPSPLCRTAALSEQAAQALGRYGQGGAAAQIQPAAVIWKQSLVELANATTGVFHQQALYLLSVIQDTLAQHGQIPLTEVVKLYNDLTPKYAPAAESMYAGLKAFCPQMV